MRRDNNQQKIALAVGIALSAGMFSIMPSAAAAPELDHVVSGGANVVQNSNVTDITSTSQNNVIDWKTFSVAQGETVRFDNGNKTNNYLNVVTGGIESQINGNIIGGKEVYIVNPNGVVFGEGSSVDVGSLYVSSRPLDKVDTTGFTNGGNPLSSVVETSSLNAIDVVNMGSVQADSVFLEGNNIKFKVGDTSVEETNYNRVMLVNNEDGWNNMNENLSGKNILTSDLVFSSESYTPYTPIGNATSKFTGSFDGQYHTVSGINVTSGTYSGLFGYTKNAKISNIGVEKGTVQGTYAGGIAGYADNTTFTNVFNEQTRVGNDDDNAYGGIVGYALNSTINTAYNTGNIGYTDTSGWADVWNSGGIVGQSDGTTIKHVYNKGTVANAIAGSSTDSSTNKNTVIDAYYTKGERPYSSDYGTTTDKVIDTAIADTALQSYTGKLSTITNSGSNAGAGENAGDIVWRIYEGQNTPLLRAFLLKGGNAVTVNYNYTHGTQSSGANDGAVSPAANVTYNGEYLKVNGTPTYSGVDNISTGKISIDSTGIRNAGTKALIYTGQQGYELIGGNVTIGKRELNLAGQTLNYTHVYNGSADVTTELQDKIENGTAVGGIVESDKNILKFTLENFSATFVDSNDNPDANAADGYKNIKLAGTISLGKAKTSVTDDAAKSAMSNYKFTGATGSITTGGMSASLSEKTAQGKISRRTLYLTQKDNVSITKEYDGTSDVDDDLYSASNIFTFGTEYDPGTTTPTSGKIKNDDVKLIANDDDDLKYYQSDGSEALNAGTWQVKYTGLTLGGTKKDNYVLMYKNADNTEKAVDSSKFFLPGTITPKLLDTSKFKVVDSNGVPVGKATREYNGEVGYDVPDGTKLNVDDVLVARDKGDKENKEDVISFALVTTGAYFAKEDGITPTANVADARKVIYKIQASTSDADHPLSNYKLSEDDTNVLTANAMTYAAAGEITRRNLQFVVKKDGIDKPYDGDSKVIGPKYTQIGGEYLDYADAKRLAAADAAVTNPLVVNAEYQAMSATNRAQDVYRVDGVVTDKTINYTITMAASIAGNYTINGQNAETPLTINKIGDEFIKGKITPLKITPNFGTVEKTYDGNQNIAGDAQFTTAVTFTGKLGSDDVDLDYSIAPGSAYFNSANVSEANKVIYTGVDLKGAQRDNYYLDSTVVKDGVAEGVGIIDRRLILRDSFTVNGVDASKVYDGTSAYTLQAGATLTSQAASSDNKGVVAGDVKHLHFSLNTTGSSYFTEEDGTTAARDVDKAKKVAYAVDATTDADYEYLLGNYKLGISDTDAVNLDDSTTGLHVSGAGHIDRRALTITAEGVQNINKTYDTTDAVKNEGNSDYFTMGKAVKYDANSLELVSDEVTGQKPSWNITASYDSADVKRDDNGDVPENGKDVTFKVYIEGNAAKNYTLNEENAEKYNGSNKLELTGAKGTIKPAVITPVFNTITKKYTGTTAITDGGANASSVELTGKFAGDEVTLNYSTDNEHAYFADSQAGNYVDGVTYKGFSLTGAKRKNYELSSDTATGTGIIDKVQLTMDDFKFTVTGVEKEYDTNTLIGDTATITVGDHYIDLGGSNHLNFTYTIAAGSAYTSTGTTLSGGEAAAVKDAATGKNVHLTITITDPDLHDNYEYTFVANKEYDFTGVGTINPKKVYATVNGPVEKTYDATTAVKSGDTTLTGDSLVNIVGKLDGTNETSAVYIDSSTGAGDAVNYGIGNKSVKYTVQLDAASAGNYVIYDDDTYTTLASVSDKFTTHNNTINQRDLKLTFNPVTKVYDGYTSYGNSTVVNNLPAYVFDPGSLQSGDNLTVADGYKANASYNSANVKEAATVTYDKLTITGKGAGNYRLLDKDGNVMTADAEGKYTTTGVGTISKYTLNSVPTITFEHVNKEYDGTNAVVYSRVPSENDTRKFINATVGTGDNAEKLGFDLVSAPLYTGGSSVNSDDGEHIRTGGAPNAAQFTIKFSSDNYEFSNINDDNFTELTDGSYQYSATYNNATITPRTITVTLGDTLSNETNHYVTKTYNADVDVKQTITGDLFNFGADDVLSKTNGSKDDVYLANTNTAGNAIKAEYDNKNSGDVKDVTYTLALAGDDANNYKLNTTTLYGKGDIQKAELVIDDSTFDAVEKTYDGNANVTTLTKDKVHLQGVQKANGDYETINVDNAIWNGTGDSTNKIIGAYDSPNVQWQVGTDEEAYQGVKYSNLQAALESMTDDDGVAISTNYYTIADTAYFEAAKEKGKIKAISITQEATKNWTPVTREYNAHDNVDGVVYAYTPATGAKGDKLLNTNDILKLTVKDKDNNDITIDYTATANYDTKDVGDNKKLNYMITGVDKKVKDSDGNSNYKLSNNVYNDLLGKTLISDTNNQITKRQLNAVVQQDSNVTKVYDGTKAASTDNFVLAADDKAVLEADGYNVDEVVQKTAAYSDENATISPGETNTNSLTIDYTMSTTADAQNYEVSTPNAAATGDITRRKLSINAVPVSVNVGESMPVFTGTVTGFAENEELQYSDFLSEVGSNFKAADSANTSTPGSYGVYGWYMGSKSGLLGTNYIYEQAPANATAFTVNYVDSGRNNPDTKITPTHNVYQQISKDKGSGFGDNAAAALEYVDKNGKIVARETIDSGEIHNGGVSLGSTEEVTNQDKSLANIGIVGGDVVNVDGVGAANQANIAVTDKGTTVNLEINSLSETGAAADKQAVAEITDMPATADNSSAQIQNLDGRQEIVEQLENKDKNEEKKESEIAIESKSSQNDDEIELKIEGSGVKVA